MPPFISKSRQGTISEFVKTQQIASSRIVVEMKMEQRTKLSSVANSTAIFRGSSRE